jgi:hypothetical protein
MTFKVAVRANPSSPAVVVKVDATNPATAQDIARWVVSHSEHLRAHAFVVEAGAATDRNDRA